MLDQSMMLRCLLGSGGTIRLTATVVNRRSVRRVIEAGLDVAGARTIAHRAGRGRDSVGGDRGVHLVGIFLHAIEDRVDAHLLRGGEGAAERIDYPLMQVGGEGDQTIDSGLLVGDEGEGFFQCMHDLLHEFVLGGLDVKDATNILGYVVARRREDGPEEALQWSTHALEVSHAA